MTAGQAQQVVQRLLGYFATPQIADEEAVAWAEALTSPDLAITPTEALTFLRRRAYAGDVYRPRPGELVSFVRDERRAQARLADTSRMLAEGRSGAVSAARTSQWVAACRRVLDGMPLDEAMRAEGILA